MVKRPAFALPLSLLLALCLGSTALAEEIIRYKPVLVQSGDNNLYPPKVLIVDTRDGHVWLWQERGRKDAPEGPADAQIIYQGRVAPGHAAGEVVSSTKARR